MGKKNRGPQPNEVTLRMLCGQAAGMCQFEGCTERLFYDDVTTAKFNASYVAHIVASSPDGPRGDENRSHLLSNKIENIMLMCDKHHRLVDDNPIDFPEEKLLEMKRRHEERISRVCALLYIPKTEILNFLSPIKGKRVIIDYNLTAAAVLPEKQPSSQFGIEIRLESNQPYGTGPYWQELKSMLDYEYKHKIDMFFSRSPGTHLSVFPLAPIPLIAYLGHLIGDKNWVDVYQKFREPDSWQWQSQEKTNCFSIEEVNVDSGKTVAIILSLTDEISYDRISDIVNPDKIFIIRAERQGVDCIRSKRDLSDFWHSYHQVCNTILNTLGRDVEVLLFPAIPVSAAFEIGRRYMPMLYPKIHIFDDINGFCKSLTIGE